MQGLGRHHATTAGKRVVGHSLVLGLYVLLARRCPLLPVMYRQKTVCQTEGVPFHSKVALMQTCIRSFEPVAGTLTHVLLDAWYSAKCIWQAARERGFAITSGLKGNRALRVEDPSAPRGWRWQTLAEYTAGLGQEAYTLVVWPNQSGARSVYVHVISTRVRKLYRCQVVIVRESLETPVAEARYWASSDLEADLERLVGHIALRWDIEVLFGDTKGELGLDQYQVMSAAATVRFWTLVLAVYTFLDEERARLSQAWQRHVTIGEARREVQRMHRRHLIDWMYAQFQAGVEPEALYDQLAA